MAITKDTAPTAHPSTHYVEKIAEQAEQELSRLRRARPNLASRIDKAEAIVCRQLGNLNGHRPIRVAVHRDGDHTYLVASDSRLSLRYAVNPHTSWTCSCPDRRRHAACKHSIACYVLDRVYMKPERKAVEPESAVADSESLRNAVPLAVAMAGLERISRASR